MNKSLLLDPDFRAPYVLLRNDYERSCGFSAQLGRARLKIQDFRNLGVAYLRQAAQISENSQRQEDQGLCRDGAQRHVVSLTFALPKALPYSNSLFPGLVPPRDRGVRVVSCSPPGIAAMPVPHWYLGCKKLSAEFFQCNHRGAVGNSLARRCLHPACADAPSPCHQRRPPSLQRIPKPSTFWARGSKATCLKRDFGLEVGQY